MRRPAAPTLDWSGTVARVVLAGVWLVSGVVKAMDLASSRSAVRGFRLLPEDLADLVGLGLPWLEIMLGLFLLLGFATRVSAVLSALLLVAFLVGVISAAARGLTIDCGCFGGGGDVAPGETRYTEEILRDLGLLALAGYLSVRPRSRLSVDGLLLGRDGAGSPDRVSSPVGTGR